MAERSVGRTLADVCIVTLLAGSCTAAQVASRDTFVECRDQAPLTKIVGGGIRGPFEMTGLLFAAGGASEAAEGIRNAGKGLAKVGRSALCFPTAARELFE